MLDQYFKNPRRVVSLCIVGVLLWFVQTFLTSVGQPSFLASVLSAVGAAGCIIAIVWNARLPQSGKAAGSLILVGLWGWWTVPMLRELRARQAGSRGEPASVISSVPSSAPAPTTPAPTTPSPAVARSEAPQPAPTASPARSAAPPSGISITGGVSGSIITQGQIGGTNIVGATPNPNAPVITYFYNGERIVRTANSIDKQRAEKAVFARLVQLHDAQDWAALAAECDDEIRKVPAWLTPYMLKGVALANLGQTGAAIELLEYVERESAGSSGNQSPEHPGWQQAGPFARKLRQQ